MGIEDSSQEEKDRRRKDMILPRLFCHDTAERDSGDIKLIPAAGTGFYSFIFIFAYTLFCKGTPVKTGWTDKT